MGILKERRMVARDVQVGGICDACGGAISLLNEKVENLQRFWQTPAGVSPHGSPKNEMKHCQTEPSGQRRGSNE